MGLVINYYHVTQNLSKIKIELLIGIIDCGLQIKKLKILSQIDLDLFLIECVL